MRLGKISTLLSVTLLSISSHATNLTVIDNVRVFDGTAAPARDSMRVVLSNGKIAALGPVTSTLAPEGAQIIDGRGKTVIPGLISAHVHLGQYDATANGSSYNRDTILRQLHQYQAYGVTTVTSLGVNGALFYSLKSELEQGLASGAAILGADRGIGVPAGAPPIKVSADQLDRPENPDSARAAVRESAARGADFIKIWLDDFQGANLVKMDPAIYKAVIDEAHKNKLKVIAHIYYQQDAKDLIRAGVDMLGHGVRDSDIDDEFLSLMRQHDTWYIPTLGVDEAFFRFAESPELLRDTAVRNALNQQLLAQYSDAKWAETQKANPALPTWKKGLAHNLKNTKRLVDAGLNVSFGTDSGAMPLRVPGYAEHRELQLLVNAGISPAKALQLATGDTARALGLQDRGVLKVGTRADVVLVDGDPTHDIDSTLKITQVWEAGKIVSLQSRLPY